MAAALEQVLAEPQPLIERIEIELVDLTLVGGALTRAADRRISRHRAGHLQHQRAVAGFQRIAPPFRRALADHAFEVQVRDDTAVGELPSLLEDARQRLGIGRLAVAHAHL